MLTDNKMPRHSALRVRAYALGLTIKEVAAEAQYHPQYVSEVLLGKTISRPALDNIEKAINNLSEQRHAA